MDIQIDVNSIKIEVRCNKCDNVIHISDQYDFNGALTVDVEPCDECDD